MFSIATFLLVIAVVGQPSEPISPCQTRFSDQSPDQRRERLAEIARKRQGAVVLVHRGMWAAAPENTLEGFAAAADYGADGVEIDIRRTRDGVLVCFHDDTVDRLLYGLGTVSELTFSELREMPMRGDNADPSMRVPTLVSVLELARQRRLLLHLDVKERDLDESIAALLAEAHLWPQVVYIGPDFPEKLKADPAFKPLAWKPDAAIYLHRRDMDIDIVHNVVKRNGHLIIVDDPRVTSLVLDRPIERRHQRFDNECNLTGDGSAPPPADLDADAAAIMDRARWALGIERRRSASDDDIARLLKMVRSPGRHPSFNYHALDAASAVRALIAVDHRACVDELIAAFRRVDPELEAIANRDPDHRYPPAWLEFRFRLAIIDALGAMPTPAGKAFLIEYLAMTKEERKTLGPPMPAPATVSLLRHNLSDDELRGLLTNANTEMRGTAILTVLDHGPDTRRAELFTVHPWTKKLPRLNAR